MANFGKILSGFLGFKRDEEPQKQEPVKEPETNDNEFTVSEEVLKDKPADNASESYGVMAPKEENKPITFVGQEGVAKKPAEKPAATQKVDDEETEYAKARQNLYKILAQQHRDFAERYNPESKEDKEKRERREKSHMALAGIGDAANAFHQAYAYARGVKPMTENKSISQATQKRIEEAKELRDKNYDAWMRHQLAAAELEDKGYQALREAKRYEREFALKEEKEKRMKAASESRIMADEARAKANYELANLYEARAKAVETDNKAELKKIDAQIDEIKSRIAKNNAGTAKENASTAEINERRERASQPKVVETREVNTNAKGKTEIKEKTQTTSTGGGNGKKANPMSGSNKKKNPMQ